MDLSAVIVNWNSGPYLGRLLDSLELAAPECTEVLVVDNASEDESLDAAVDRSGVRVERLERNLGFAAAANAGIRLSEAEAILLLNPDVEVIGESLRGLRDALSARSETAIVCGALLDENRVSQARFQLRSLPTLASVLSDSLFIDELVGFQKASPAEEPSAGRVEQPAAAYWLLRKAAWRDLGGFDERFVPAWFEDVDFCKRLTAAGWGIEYLPEFPATHRGGISVDVLGYRTFIRIYYRNLLRYWRKHHPATFPLIWLPVQLGVLLRLVKGRR